MRTMEAGVEEVQAKTRLLKILDQLSRLVLVSLLFTVLVAIGLSVARTFWNLRVLLYGDLSQGIKRVVIGVLAVLALVEVYRTAYVYFSEGRVKVTYIVDAVLVVLMTEILSVWYSETDYRRISMAVALVLLFGLIRVLAIRYSPTRAE